MKISEAAKQCADECYDNTRGVSGSEDIADMAPIIQRTIDFNARELLTQFRDRVHNGTMENTVAWIDEQIAATNP